MAVELLKVYKKGALSFKSVLMLDAFFVNYFDESPSRLESHKKFVELTSEIGYENIPQFMDRYIFLRWAKGLMVDQLSEVEQMRIKRYTGNLIMDYWDKVAI